MRKVLTSPQTLWLLIGLLLVALTLRLNRLQLQSLWFDEGWSAFAAVQPALLEAAAADATNPPLYYMLLNAAAGGIGFSEFSLRLFSTFWGLLVVALTYRLARRLFNEAAGVFAAWLAVISPLLWWAAQEARMYTLLAALALTAALAWHRLLRQPGRAAWLTLWGAELALLYTHNTGPAAALWLNLMTIFAWDAYRSFQRPPWRMWISGQMIVGLLWLPYFATRFLLLGEANSAVSSAPVFGLALLNDTWTAFWAGNWALVGREPLLATFWQATPYIGLSGAALLLAAALVPWRRLEARFAAGHAAVLVIGIIVGLVVLRNEMHGRYLVIAAPFLLVALGAGIAALVAPLLRYAAAAFFLAIFAAVLYYTQSPLYWHDDVRGMVQHYADTTDSGDTVLAWSYADRYDLWYYWDRLSVPARRVTLPEGADLAAILPLLPASGDVHLNVWYTQRADYRGMLGCVLGHGRSRPPEQFTTYGMTDLRYADFALDPPQLQPYRIDYEIARVEQVGRLPNFQAQQTLCLPVQIALTQPTRTDLKAAVILQNALGWEIARADAVLAAANQVTSTGAEAGAALTAYAPLRLPYGAPAGDYRVFLRLYNEDLPSGYEVRAAPGAVLARDALLGTWRALGADWTQVEAETHLPVRFVAPVTEALTLVASGHDPAVPIPVRSGDTVRLELLWRGAGELPPLRLEAGDAAPDYMLDPLAAVDGNPILDWREIDIPADAPGAYTLRAGAVVVARFMVEALPLATEPPDFDTPVDVAIPGIGTLVGYSVEAETSRRDAPLPVTLVWQAGEFTPGMSYTVFVQLLDTSGALIAQSDSVPAGGLRPTTGWRSGEYITDDHALRFNQGAQPGVARLIVGMYDPATGVRLLLADRSNAIQLPGEIVVE